MKTPDHLPEFAAAAGSYLWNLFSYVLWTCFWVGAVAWICGETVPGWGWVVVAGLGFNRFRVAVTNHVVDTNTELIGTTVTALGQTQSLTFDYIRKSEKMPEENGHYLSPHRHN